MEKDFLKNYYCDPLVPRKTIKIVTETDILLSKLSLKNRSNPIKTIGSNC